MEKYYLPCVKKTIEQIYRNRRLIIRKLFVMAYLSVQNILFYNYGDSPVNRGIPLTDAIRKKAIFHTFFSS